MRVKSQGRLRSAVYVAVSVLTMLVATLFLLDAIREWRPCGEVDVGAKLAESAAAAALTLVSCWLWLEVKRLADDSYDNIRGAASVALVLAAFVVGFAFFLGVVLLSPGIAGEFDTCGFDSGIAVVRAAPILGPFITLAVAVVLTPRRRQITLRGAAWFGAIVLGIWLAVGAVSQSIVH